MADGLTVELGDLLLTGTDDAGVDWRTFSPIGGWDGSPGSSQQSTQKSRAPGAWKSPAELTSRIIVANGAVEAPDEDTLQDAMDRLNAAVALATDAMFAVTRGSRRRWCFATRQDDVVWTDENETTALWSFQMEATEPRKFADDLVAETGLPSVSGGLAVPFTVPFTLPATVVSGLVPLTNPGTAVGPVKLRIDGPVTGPMVTHVGSGLQLVFASSLAIAAGQWLEVDMENQTALLNGVVSRNNTITNRGWSGFEPGVNEWAFSAVSGSGLLTVTATPAWL